MTILHPSRSLTALLPRYVSRFSCIGPSCEDSCCAGWQVTIDKKTFTAYKQSNHQELKPVFENSVKRTRGHENDVNYARIDMVQETGACPLMHDRLCSVQTNLNETYLSDTCFSYPRLTRQFAGGIEQSLTLSCPEAARQALLNADAFDFVEHTISLRDSSVNKVRPAHGLGIETMNEVRIFCFQLMRIDGMALWEKLAVLGVFCEALTKAIQAHQQGGIPALIEEFTGILETGSVVDALRDLQPNHVSQALVFAALWELRIPAARSPSQREILETIAKGMEAIEAGALSKEEQIVDGYRRGIERLTEALQEAPHLLEHYVLNEMFTDLFPFGASSPYEHYLRLVSRFGMLRFMLAALCKGSESVPTPAVLVQTVQLYCRRFQHDARFATQTSEVLHNSGWNRLEKIYSFLRY